MKVVILILIFTEMLILKIILNIKVSDIKKIKKIGYDTNLNEITNKFPSNIEICKDILKMLENENVKIEETSDEKSKTSLYIAITNKIIIANIKDTFTRIQTIAHECIHSVQDKKMQLTNFILANFNIIYFILTGALIIFKVITNKEIISIIYTIYILLAISLFILRSFLEIDAMEKARYVAEEYIECKKIISTEEQEVIIKGYDELNKVGIKLYVFILAAKAALKIGIYGIILTIFS